MFFSQIHAYKFNYSLNISKFVLRKHICLTKLTLLHCTINRNFEKNLKMKLGHNFSCPPSRFQTELYFFYFAFPFVVHPSLYIYVLDEIWIHKCPLPLKNEKFHIFTCYIIFDAQCLHTIKWTNIVYMLVSISSAFCKNIVRRLGVFYDWSFI